MSACARTALASLALLLGAVLPATSPAQGTGVLVNAEVISQGTTKFVWIEAVQQAATAPAAAGGVIMLQVDPTGRWGDFSLIGQVVCMKLTERRAVIGLVMLWGLGTGAGRTGEIFYVTAEDGANDYVDNGGWIGERVPNCDTQIGMPGTGGQVVKGAVSIFPLP